MSKLLTVRTWVGTPENGASFMGITPSFRLQLDISYVFFDHLNERNEMVKSIPYFDNFTK